MKRFDISESLSSCHPFHFKNNSSHTPVHGCVDPSLTGFPGGHLKRRIKTEASGTQTEG